MSSLSANLKLYLPFQKNRFINNLYLIQIVIFSIFYFPPETKVQMINAVQPGIYPFTPMLPFFISMAMLGYMVAALQIDILVKPVSSCIPGLENIFFKVTLFTGIAGSIFYFLLFLLLPFPHTGFRYTIFVFLVSCSGLSFYFTAFLLSYKMKQHDPNTQIIYILFLIPILFYVLIIYIDMQHLTYTFQSYIVLCFAPLCSATALGYLGVSLLLKNTFLKSIYSAKYHRTFINSNKEWQKNAWFNINIPDDNNRESRLIEYTIKKMNKEEHHSLRKNIIGIIYCWLEKLRLSCRRKLDRYVLLLTAILVPLIQILTGYRTIDGEVLPALLPFIQYAITGMLSFTTALLLAPGNNDILLPIGRSGIFYSNYTSWYIKPALIMIPTIFVVILSWCIKDYMPDLFLLEYNFTYTSMDTYLIFFPLILAPAIDLSIDKFMPDSGYFSKPVNFFILLIFGTVLFYLFISFLFIDNISNRIFNMALMIIISNGTFAILLSHRWFKRDAV